MADIEPIYQEIASKITKEENKALPRVVKKIASLEQARILRELPNTVRTHEKRGKDTARKTGNESCTYS